MPCRAKTPPEVPTAADRRSRIARVAGRMVAALVGVLVAGGVAGRAHAAGQPEATIAHGPFEIQVKARSISRGTFPNQGGNPFATREVADFRVRWRGKSVSVPGGNEQFWRVLRLEGAPRPALLLVTSGFVLASEDAGGQLQVTPIATRSASLAELQWLDARAGQPDAPQTFGIEALPDLASATVLAGGRWLRLGYEAVLDVGALKVHPVAPWVPTPPGQPIVGLDRASDLARAFSPGRTKYVLLAAGTDYARPGQPRLDGLLVVDIASGVATQLVTDRRRFRFAASDEVTADWVAHHFEWSRDARGDERLVPRARFAPWPWRSFVHESRQGVWELKVRRIDPAFLDVMRRVVLAVPGARAVPDADSRTGASNVELDGCVFRTAAYDGADADGFIATLWPRSESQRPGCEPAIRRLAAAIDAELATGRHDALMKFD